MAYLVFNTKEEALERADQEGILKNYWYHRTGISGAKNKTGTRYKTYPAETASGNWALDVSDYTLTDSESSSTVNTVNFPNIEA